MSEEEEGGWSSDERQRGGEMTRKEHFRVSTPQCVYGCRVDCVDTLVMIMCGLSYFYNDREGIYLEVDINYGFGILTKNLLGSMTQ